MNYKTLKAAAQFEFTEQRSKFIGFAAPVKDEASALKLLADIKQSNKEATHNVYAYCVRENNTSRYSDDGEPHGTAGIPVLTVINGHEVTDCIIVATRYFGGTLLGKGGLVKAYTEAAKGALQAAGIAKMSLCDLLSVTADYSLFEQIKNLITEMGGIVKETNFTDAAQIIFLIDKSLTAGFSAELTELTGGRAEAELLESRFEAV